MMSRNHNVHVLIAIALFAAQAPVQAYIDPGSTSLFLQGLIGAVAALLVITKSYWQRALSRFRRTDDADASRRSGQR